MADSRRPSTGSTRAATSHTPNAERAKALVHRLELLELLTSTEVFITHKHRDSTRITHVRCWYRSEEKDLFVSDVFLAEEVIAAWNKGQRQIYTAGLSEVDEEDFDFELLHEEGDTVVEDHFHHPKTKGDGAKYNNLGELADFDPSKPRNIEPTFGNPPTKNRPWAND